MANRRFGGNQRGGGRSFQQANLNPWQGGVAPGNSLDNNIQAQLALALSNLLQPQQQNNPPSLLSLNTSPGYANQGNNYNPQNRFGGSRGRSDFRRSEPYNKNRVGGNWRNDRRNFSSPRSNSRSFKDRKSDNDKSKISDSAKTSEKLPKSLDDSKSNKNTETEIIDISMMEESREEDSSELFEKKRDWLKEKNNSETNDDADTKETKRDGNEKETTQDEVKKEKKDNSKFAGLPSGFLHCFVCDKSMWDGESFQNHIRGKAHKQMLNSLEDSFQITVNILRENMRLTEEKKMIELNRIQRNNRKFMHKFQEPESHCNMCDLKFLGKIISHRKTEGHQRLKRFLHPNCDTCNLEFPSRMEWVDHRFSPEHLLKLKEVLDNKKTPEDGYKIDDEDSEFEIEPLLQENMHTEDDNPILELTDDLQNLQNRIPSYMRNRPVSTASLTPAQGFTCNICNKFFASEDKAQAHLKTEGHYHNFVTAVKNKYQQTANEKTVGDADDSLKGIKIEIDTAGDVTAETTQSDSNIKEGDAIYDPEEACNEEDNEDDKPLTELKETTADESWLDEAFPIDSSQEEEKEAEVKDENEASEDVNKEPEVETTTKNLRKRGAVRNGAGPKSKVRGKK